MQYMKILLALLLAAYAFTSEATETTETKSKRARKEVVKAEVKTTSGKNHLTDGPLVLILMKLSYLEAKELDEFRMVSKACADIVNKKTRQTIRNSFPNRQKITAGEKEPVPHTLDLSISSSLSLEGCTRETMTAFFAEEGRSACSYLRSLQLIKLGYFWIRDFTGLAAFSKLTELRLTWPYSDSDKLAEAVKGLPVLTSLDLTIHAIEVQDPKEVERVLHSAASLKNLCLCFRNGLVAHVPGSLASLKSIPLESLSLEASSWDKHDGEALVKGLSGSMASTLREFHFNGAIDSKALATGLGSCKALRSLTLEDHNVSEEVLQSIQQSQKSLTSLCFKDFRFLSQSSTGSLMVTLANCSALTDLSFQNPKNAGEEEEECDQLDVYTIFSALENWPDQCSSTSGLKAFKFAEKTIDDRDAQCLARALVKHPKLETLNLSDCLRNIRTLPPMLGVLDSLVLIRHLNFSSSDFENDLLKQLVAKLPKLKKLQTLDLSDCSIDSGGARVIAGAYKDLPFTVLLSRNRIGDEGADKIIESIKKGCALGNSTRLRCLDLSGNRIGEETQRKLCVVRDRRSWLILTVAPQRAESD